jgi:hypothetical protein
MNPEIPTSDLEAPNDLSATTAKSAGPKSKRTHKRQARRAIPTGLPRLKDRSKLLQAKRWTAHVLSIKPRRYLETKTGRSGAWWEHIANGDFDHVRFTLVDWYIIRAISSIVTDEDTLDSEILTKLMRVLERNAALVTAVTDLIAGVRHKTKTVRIK